MSQRVTATTRVSAQANARNAGVKPRSGGRSQYVDAMTIAQAFTDRRAL
jgi:hypothetical protein